VDQSITTKKKARLGALLGAALVAIALPLPSASAATAGTTSSAALCTVSITAPRVVYVEGKGMLIEGRGGLTCDSTAVIDVTVCIQSAINPAILLGCSSGAGARSATAVARIPCAPGDWLTYMRYRYVGGAGERRSGVTTVRSECASA
jgi:hypothetical protein